MRRTTYHLTGTHYSGELSFCLADSSIDEIEIPDIIKNCVTIWLRRPENDELLEALTKRQEDSNSDCPVFTLTDMAGYLDCPLLRDIFEDHGLLDLNIWITDTDRFPLSTNANLYKTENLDQFQEF